MTDADAMGKMTDAELDRELRAAVTRERTSLVPMLRLIGEIDSRKAYLPMPFPSMFQYCTKRLNLIDNEAYLRIRTARAARRFPVILDRIRDGRASMSAVARLAKHMTPANHRELLDRIEGRSFYEVLKIKAEFEGQADVPDRVRPIGRSSPDIRVEIRFAADDAFVETLNRAKAVLWHKSPYGKLEEIFAIALKDCLDKRDPMRRVARRRARESALEKNKAGV